MAVELRNALMAAVEVPLPASLLLDYPTVAAVATYLGEQLDGAAEHEAARGDDAAPARSRDEQDAEELLARLDSFSETEVDALLVRMLAESARSEASGHDDCGNPAPPKGNL
jgi:hypothetical protein